jgi:hypothetical protein
MNSGESRLEGQQAKADARNRAAAARRAEQQPAPQAEPAAALEPIPGTCVDRLNKHDAAIEALIAETGAAGSRIAALETLDIAARLESIKKRLEAAYTSGVPAVSSPDPNAP